MLKVTAGNATSIGRVRTVNQDSLLVRARLFAVADGMGGHAAGEIASGIAVARLERMEARPGLSQEDVVSAVEQANHDILDAVRSDPDLTGMGTTLTGLAVVSFAGPAHWLVFNVGDSRVYRFANRGVERITVDHSEVEELVAAGEISREDARHHPQSNIVTRSLGTDPAPQVDAWVFPVENGDTFLLCSDGLTRELDERSIGSILAETPEPQRAAESLVEAAVSAGGSDNVTAVVVTVESVDGAQAGPSGDTAPRPLHPVGS
jgi:PPM family protein phosphatase